jgi:hypothetical protein
LWLQPQKHLHHRYTTENENPNFAKQNKPTIKSMHIMKQIKPVRKKRYRSLHDTIALAMFVRLQSKN